MSLSPTTVPVPPDPGLPHGPLARFLSDPTAWLHAVAHGAAHVARSAGAVAPDLVIAAVVVAAVAAAVRRLLRARAGEASFVELLVPPEVDPAGAVAFWRRLHAVLGPRRFGRGRPAVVFEAAGSPAGVRIGVWVPSGLSPTAVSKAAGAAWPGTMAVIAPPPAALGAGRVVGGRLRLAGPEWFAISAHAPGDPLRGVLGELSDCAEGESAVMQVAARPASARRLARARRAAIALRAGRPTSALPRAIDAWTTHPPGSSAPADPLRAAEVRMVAAKLADAPAWAVAVHYGCSGPATTRAERFLLRSRARGIADAFGVYAGRNHLRPAGLRRAGVVLAERRSGRGQLMGTTELAGLAHLPTERMAGLSPAGAAPVAPQPAAFGAEDDDGLF